MGEVVACLRVERKVAAVVGDDGTWPIHWDCRVKDPTLCPPQAVNLLRLLGHFQWLLWMHFS